MKIYRVTDKEFNEFGTVVTADTAEIIEAGEKIPMPEQGVKYVPSQAEFEPLEIASKMKLEVFGGMPIQMGYCWGSNDTMNAMEWHKNSEINIAVTDMILLLGKVQDIENNRYDSANVMAFLMKKGEAVEMYATTLHYCPIQTSEEGFRCVVILPEGTNTPIDDNGGNKLITAKNKWLIAHEECERLLEKGYVPGIYGENYKF